MQLANVAPNLITYNALIHACATVGATDAAFQVRCALDPVEPSPPRPPVPPRPPSPPCAAPSPAYDRNTRTVRSLCLCA